MERINASDPGVVSREAARLAVETYHWSGLFENFHEFLNIKSMLKAKSFKTRRRAIETINHKIDEWEARLGRGFKIGELEEAIADAKAKEREREAHAAMATDIREVVRNFFASVESADRIEAVQVQGKTKLVFVRRCAPPKLMTGRPDWLDEPIPTTSPSSNGRHGSRNDRRRQVNATRNTDADGNPKPNQGNRRGRRNRRSRHAA